MTENVDTDKAFSFALKNFSGPLDLLLFLVQKKELDIYDVRIQNITTQYYNYLTSLAALSVNSGAEFLSKTALLVHIKSQTLLPKLEAHQGPEPEEPFSILPKLIEYYKFKGLAKELAKLEVRENVHYPRAVPKIGSKKFISMGINHLSLDDLKDFFQEALDRAASLKKEVLDNELWTVGDRIDYLRNYLQENAELPLIRVFTDDACRDELVINFLAILELMKMGEVSLVCDRAKGQVLLTRKIEVSKYVEK